MASAAATERGRAAQPRASVVAWPPALALALVLALSVLLVLPAGAGAQSGAALKRLAGFDSPVHVHGPPGSRGAVLVVEQGGTVRAFLDGRKRSKPFLNLSSRVASGGEQGLLSIAFPPRYPRDRRFYVFYTDRAGDLRIDELRRHSRQRLRAVRKTRRTVLRIRHQPFANHNGGQLAFGPDGLLYIATGDGGGGGDPQGNAQDRRSLLGKILRIDPRKRRGRPYTVPRGNPFVGRSGRNAIFSLGLRNPWRFSFDGRRIAIADVGQGRWEELNYARLADARGANFGWNRHEGPEVFSGGPGPLAPSERTDPIFAYRTGQSGNCAITGGHVARGKRVPGSLRGRYVYADFCRGQLRSLVARPAGARGDRALAGVRTLSQVSSFGVDQAGRLYVASLSGPVFRIVPR